MKNRRDFLKEVCPTVAFAFFGVSFLEACSADSLDEDTGDGTTPPADNGYTKSGSTYTIDLTHSNFSELAQDGGWMNGQNFGIPMLFLRTSSTSIQAYSNRCPAHGQRNQWEKPATTALNVITNNILHCNTDCSDNTHLNCYETSISGDELTLTLS